MKKTKRKNQTIGEEIGNAITHGVGFLLAIVATIFLLIKANSTLAYVCAGLFGFGLMFLYLNSTLYHAFKQDSTVKRVYKRFDHLSIYFLISATFAPILLLVIGGRPGWTFFIIQWALTILGMIAKVLWPNRFQPLHLVLFLLIGWSGLFFMLDIYHFSTTLVLFIGLGGISYTIGVLFYAFFRFKFHHFIWHFFVLGGSILHYIGIYLYVF